jgi:pimeloyl-ACP methyl ester carboxylesterase
VSTVERPREATRARYPDEEGYVERDGVRVFWERYGEGSPAILFMAPGVLVHSRTWKGQIAYFARRHRVIVFDGRGNGRSDRPLEPAAYGEPEFAADGFAVMDATGTDAAVLVGGGRGVYRSLLAAAEQPERVLGLFLAAPDWWLRPEFVEAFLADPREHYGEGWDRLSPHYFRRDWEGFVRWWMPLSLPQPHSTKALEDAIEWGLETDADVFSAAAQGPGVGGRELRELGAAVECPAIVIEGEHDCVAPPGQARMVADAIGCDVVRFPRAGHAVHAREPVRFNLTLREFVEQVAAGGGG